MSAPLCIDLFCGLGGWTEGFLAEGWECVGFDIEQHVYGAHRYPAHLVLQDVRTLHGSQFKHADMIVASSPCQEFSYRAMPWKRAKALGPPVLGMELFAQAARIQREACAAAGRHIPMIQENVRGAQKYVGRAQWHYGSYYLWGDVPALMPVVLRRAKVGSLGWSEFATTGVKSKGFNTTADQLVHGRADTAGTVFEDEAVKVPSEDGRRTDVGKGARFTSRDCGDERGQKNTGGSWFNIGGPGQQVTNQNPVHRGRVNRPDHTQVIDPERGTKGYAARLGDSQISRRHGSKSSARKAASARIAKIPAPLARYIAQVYLPRVVVAA